MLNTYQQEGNWRSRSGREERRRGMSGVWSVQLYGWNDADIPWQRNAGLRHMWWLQSSISQHAENPGLPVGDRCPAYSRNQSLALRRQTEWWGSPGPWTWWSCCGKEHSEMFKWRVEQSSKKNKSLPKGLARPGRTGRKEENLHLFIQDWVLLHCSLRNEGDC